MDPQSRTIIDLVESSSTDEEDIDKIIPLDTEGESIVKNTKKSSKVQIGANSTRTTTSIQSSYHNGPRSESDVDEEDYDCFLEARIRKRHRQNEVLSSPCNKTDAENRSSNSPEIYASTQRFMDSEQQWNKEAPIFLFATNSDVSERMSISNNKKQSKENIRNHWSYTQCRTLREMIGLDPDPVQVQNKKLCTNHDSCNRMIEWIVIVNYIINIDFLLDELPELVTIKRVLVFYGSIDDTIGTSLQQWKDIVKDNNDNKSILEFIQLRPSDPPKSASNPLSFSIPYGVHHTKCFLIGYSNQSIRICIHTSNLRNSDVHNKAQGAYIQEFPMKKKKHDTTGTTFDYQYPIPEGTISIPKSQHDSKSHLLYKQQPNDFEETLVSYFSTYGYNKVIQWSNNDLSPVSFVECLRRYDYSNAQAILIPSTPGYHPVSLLITTSLKMTQKEVSNIVTGKDVPTASTVTTGGPVALNSRNPYHQVWKKANSSTNIGNSASTTTASISSGNKNDKSQSVFMTEQRSALRGYISLRQAILDYTQSPATDSNEKKNRLKSRIVCQFSSIGSLTEKYLHELHKSMDIHCVHDCSGSNFANISPRSASQLLLVYPTVEEIRTSIEGYRGGGSVPGSAKNTGKPFLFPYYHKWSARSTSIPNDGDDHSISIQQDLTMISTETNTSSNQRKALEPLWKGRNVPHIKTYYQVTTFSNKGKSTTSSTNNKRNQNERYSKNDNVEEKEQEDCFDWFVLTSHNLSKAAWGETIQRRLTTTNRNQQQQQHHQQCLFVRHWELGVFMSPMVLGTDKLIPYTNNGNSSARAKMKTIPLPYPIHPIKYNNLGSVSTTSNSSKKDVPWAVDVLYNIPDNFGRHSVEA